MTAKPRKPLLVNLTWAAAIVLVLPAFYLAAFGIWAWAYAVGYVSFDTHEELNETIFGPCSWFIQDTDYPGSEALSKYYTLCFWAGAERSHREASGE